jgi:outer membrane protein OmpA-like peptidoglycan-associated protein
MSAAARRYLSPGIRRHSVRSPVLSPVPSLLRCSPLFRRASTGLLATALLLLSACQILSTPTDSGDANTSRTRPYYVRVQPEATSLVAVNDDGENTFLEFGILPPGELKLFDSDGKPLRAVWVRNMAILAGTHQGILLRLGTATSYISLHPQADRLRKPALTENAVVHELRDRLLQDGQRGAMERALVKANNLEQTGGAISVSALSDGSRTAVSTIAIKPDASRAAGSSVDTTSSTPNPTGAMVANALNAVSTTNAMTAMNAANPGNAAGLVNASGSLNAAGPVNPMAAANSDSSELAWPRTQRVFFATNSVGISAPDDGLQRLLQDARQSDEIWIAGHTDNTGPRDVNVVLAKRRAAAVKFILTSRGISPERIVTVRAHADTYIAGNETEVGRSQNRRVEVTFVRSRAVSEPRAGLNSAPAR